MSDDCNEGAKEGRQSLSRRASDKPHVFERNKGFRTCRACGLPKKHEVHQAEPSKSTPAGGAQPPSIEQLRERLRDNPPPEPPRFAISHIVLVSVGLIVVVVGLAWLALFRFNNAVDEPLQEVLRNPNNQIVRATAHFDGLDSHTLVFDLTDTAASASRLDVFQSFLQYAQAMKAQRFAKLILAYRGVKKFTLEGGYFQQLGQEHAQESPVYIVRNFPPHLTAMDGSKPFSAYPGDLLENVTKEVGQFTEFSDKWYARDAAVFALTSAGSSTAIAAEAMASSANDYWLVLDSRNTTDNTPEVSLHNAGTEGAVLTIRCANQQTEAYVDTDTVLSNKGVRVRFDGSAPVRQSWYRSASDKALFAPDAIAFARRLANTRTLHFEFTPLENQESTVVFDVSGLDGKLQKISDNCNWAPIDKNHLSAKVSAAALK